MQIDGVFSGGGIKAYAFIGALEVLEERGYEFKRVAGTSAGSVLAAFLAAGYNVREMESLLNDLELQSLLDPPHTSRTLPFMKWVNLYFRFGIYRGNSLEKWFYKLLAQKGVYTFGDLPKNSLKLVATDLTNGKIIVLPDDLENYGFIARKFSVAKALRMSCGIPFFFEPVILNNGGKEAVIVDGGVLSNFPLWIFDNGNKERPILGLKLSSPQEELKPHEIKNGLGLFEALFTTMKDAHDDRYISRKHEKNIIFIPVEDYSATQFNIDKEKVQNLIQIGRQRTEKFLTNWTPTNY